MTAFPDTMTLGEARPILRELVEEGYACPLCTQFAKVYKRKVNSSMARDLIVAWRSYGLGYGYLPELRRKTGSKDNREESKLRYWGLMVEDDERREDGGRAGFWRVTPDGADWVLGRSFIPKYAHIYDGRCLGHEGPLVSIQDALGSRFNYDELMRGE